MRVGDLTADHVGKMISVEGRAGILKAIGRKARTVTDVWCVIHLEVVGGNSVLFMREHETVMVEP